LSKKLRIAFLIQGPVHNYEHALKIEMFLGKINFYLNPSLIILNSHNNEFVKHIKFANFPNLSINEIIDPGCYVTEPIRNVPLNLDRQLSTSSSSLINKYKIDVVIKTRSDLFLTSLGFIAIKIILSNWYFFKNKTFVIPITTSNPLDSRYPLFQVCDWFYIMNSNLYSSVFNFYSLKDRVEHSVYIKGKNNLLYGAENFICLKFLKVQGLKIIAKDMWDNSFRRTWNELFKKYFIVLPYLGFFKSIKYRRVYKNLYHSYGFGLGFNFYYQIIRALLKC
jgi:hypothetical protein